MANVRFLKGTQSALNTLIEGSGDRYIEGAFYLTSDTDRLYVAQSASNLVLLNSIVKHVASVSALPAFNSSTVAVGDFYYAEAENVLCTKRAGQSAWTQINKDTNNRIVNTTSAVSASDTTGGVTVTTTVTDDGTGATARSATGSFTIKEGDNVDITRNGNEITISSDDTQYGLSAANNKVQLTTAGGTTGDAGEVTLAMNSSGFGSISTADNTITINVPKPNMTVSKSFGANGVLTTIVTDSNNANQSGSNVNTITPIIELDSTVTEDANQQYKFASGTATLPVYTKSQVDNLLTQAGAAMNAMTYKGTVNASQAAATFVSTANVGDTYKAATNITKTASLDLLQGDAKVGDLIIAYGDSNGNITAWHVVPSGDDYTLSSTLSGTNVTINDQTTHILAGITINGGNHISTSGSVSGQVNTITVNQAADYTAQNTTGMTTTGDVALNRATGSVNPQSVDFVAITGIQTDTYGNVVDGSIKTSKLTVVDSHANITSVTPNVSVTNNKATVKYTVGDSDNKSANGSFYLDTTGSVSITKGSVSGEQTVVIDVVWGSF